MALSLKDLKKKKVQVKPEDSIKEKKKILRPWESYNQFETKVRTYTARYAVKKAKERDLKIEGPKVQFNLNTNELILSDLQSRDSIQGGQILVAACGPEKFLQTRKEYPAISQMRPAGIFSFIRYVLQL